MTYWEKTFTSITQVLLVTFEASESTSKQGFLQKIDPRIKILGGLFILVAINLFNNWIFFICIYFFVFLLAYVSRISLSLLISRALVLASFFSLLIALPAALNWFTPGEAVVTIVNLPNQQIFLSITKQGTITALRLMIRSASSILLSLLLVMTTNWIGLLKALDKLHVPRIFTAICLMSYRYIYLLLETASQMLEARKSRMLGRPNNRINRFWISGSLGTLISKTYQTHEEVYLAMRSRGFRGQINYLDSHDKKIKQTDY